MSARGWAGFAAMSLIWGIPYLFIKIAVDGGVSPLFLSWARVAMAAALLFAIVPGEARRLLGGAGPVAWLLAYAFSEISIPFPLIAFGETRVSSSVTAIIIACVPLIVALLAMRVDHSERPTGIRLLGMLIGLGGVVALVGIDIAGRASELVGAGAVLVAAVGYSVGPMIVKHRLAPFDPRATMAASLAIAAVVLAPAAALSHPTELPSTSALIAIVVLGVVCTATAFVVFNSLIKEIGPSRAVVITYVNPVIAVALGVTVLGEQPGAGAIAGLLLILAGSWLATDGRLPPGPTAIVTRARRRRRPADAPTPAPGAIR
jgi:drug/metabolite transporter (DMT)-like permease